MVLLFGAGLLLRTLLAMENVDRGYRAQGALTMLVLSTLFIAGDSQAGSRRCGA